MVRFMLVALRWKMRANAGMAELAKEWHKRPISVLLVYIFIAMLWYWELHVPSPGVAVTAMAVAAALMPLRGEMEGREKVMWIVLLFGFLFLELTAISTERKADESLRAQARWQESQHFREIGKEMQNGVQGILDQSQQQFQATLAQQSTQFNGSIAKTQQGIDAITGGKSFCYAFAVYESAEYASLALFVKGNSPLHNVESQIIDLDTEQELLSKQPFTPELGKQFMHFEPTIPFLSAMAGGRDLGEVPLTGITSRRIAINFYSTNGTWQQRLTLRKVKGHWTQASIVTKNLVVASDLAEMKNPGVKLYSYSDPDFPQKPDGAPDL